MKEDRLPINRQATIIKFSTSYYIEPLRAIRNLLPKM